MNTITYFVPIDFSEASYNALQYATLLAGESDGQVKLCHVVDLNELPESDNQVVVSMALNKLIKDAERKLKSLREFISLDAINVEDDILIGNVNHCLTNRIEKLKPDVIVIGRRTENKINNWSATHHITSNTSIPVLVIPQSHNPGIPNKAVLTIDVSPEVVIGFKTLLTIIKRISPELSILNIRDIKRNSDTKNWLEDLRLNYGINACILSKDDSFKTRNLDDFIKENKIDFLYNIKPKKGLIKRILHSLIDSTNFENASVPLLIYSPE